MAICCLLYVIASHDATYILQTLTTSWKLDGQQKKIETEFPTSTMFLFDIQITLYLYP